MDIEFPTSARYYAYIMTSIAREYENAKEPPGNVKKTTNYYLRTNLYLDFVFIFPAYTSVAIMCCHVSSDLGFLPGAFKILAFLQIGALLLDAGENIFILATLKKPKLFLNTEDTSHDMKDDELTPNGVYTAYKLVVFFKWLFVGVGLIASLMAIFYHFSIGYYSDENGFILSLVGILALCVFFVVNPWKKKPEKKESRFEIDIIYPCEKNIEKA